MEGLAQKLFREREGKAPWKLPNVRWPLLKKLVETKRLSAIDLELAEMLLKPFPEASEESACFISYMSLAIRHGHLCVRVAEQLSPEPRALLLDPESDPEPIAQFEQAIRKRQLPSSLVSGIPIHRKGDRYYFQRYWMAEKQCVETFNSLNQSSPLLQVDREIIASEVDSLLSSGKLLPEQGEAILKAMSHSLTLLCGGPGTGKTYTIGHLIHLFLKGLPVQKRDSCQVALAAPTGKAAVHLENSLSHVLPGKKATTLHALLGINSRQIPSLSADLVIVDESSMIDLKVMNALLTAIKPGARLILVGDRHQLSPVESGSLFADLVQYAPSATVELKQCLRTELASIAQFASSIQTGQTADVLDLLSQSREGLIYHALTDASQTTLVEETISRFQKEKYTPERLLTQFNAFRLLSPLRRGPFGVDALNRLCATLAAKRSHPAAPIIITQTDRQLGLFNGEVGVLIRDEGYALFAGEGGKIRRFSILLLPAYEYAYCLSVYKSQGSEFDEVLLVLPKGSEYFGREVLYTAVTRARRQVQIWSTAEVLTQTIERQAVRLSGICDSVTEITLGV